MATVGRVVKIVVLLVTVFPRTGDKYKLLSRFKPIMRETFGIAQTCCDAVH